MSFQYTKSSNSLAEFDEHRWLSGIQQTMEEELENDHAFPVSIFNVPKTLMACDPASYTPQLVAIGPYHYWSTELYEMERYKISAAKRTQKQLQTLKFQDVVDHLIKLELKIRASYHKFLNFNKETLGWMMAIDACFLLEFLQIYAIKEGVVTVTRVSSGMSHLVDYTGRKSAHNSILKDMVMLENQIPLFVLRETLEVQFSSLEIADERLLLMLEGFRQELSPFKMIQDLPKIQVLKCAHLLDYLYDTIVPKLESSTEITEAEYPPGDEADQNSGNSSYVKYFFKKKSFVKDFFSEIWELLSKLNKGPIRLLKAVLFSRPVKVLLKLPWKILSNLPGFSILKQPVQFMFFSRDKEEVKPENKSSNKEINKPPLVEEIAIPSVTQLSKSCVMFSPTGNVLSITFDPKTRTFYLPTVSLDVNTEVVLRNLVAYEASNASGPLVFTRYTELMNGIIDTAEDVKLLREKGIIMNRMKSDEEVANLWNGMSKSIRLTRVPFLDKAIEDVNKHYNGRWKVKIMRFVKAYVFGSWQFLTLIAAICLVLLMGLQAFCSVYTCGRMNVRITHQQYMDVVKPQDSSIDST
ncbi:hypothetical protein K2173_019277 [Erythroxylum novogranatense]|uniref:Uncharacterized protein n=1 Tax=Erythroxylum novogranatense TaxID=1862640 RepID=A0AAV8STZ3_9ROSI|nr:hypothetical protein K2173_019277 [Erythroxylum novogranatense]